MLTRDQEYAAKIFDQVSRLPQPSWQKYGSMAHKLPILIRTAGLAQALAFVESRGSEEQRQLLADLAAVVNPGLVAQSRAVELGEYRRLTHDVLRALEWYKRFAQSVLHVDAADEEESEEVKT